MTARGEQTRHDFLYWEFPSYGGQQAVQAGKWKLVRQNLNNGPSTFELYDLHADPAESKNVAAEHPALVKRLEAIAREQHTPSELFPLPSVDPRPKK